MATPFTILNSRKRVLIALIHSIFFLGLATRDLVVNARLAGVLGVSHVTSGSLILAGIYLVVSGVLITLLWYSGGLLERLYFGFCAASASSGLVRVSVGDANFGLGRFCGSACWWQRSAPGSSFCGFIRLRWPSVRSRKRFERAEGWSP